MKKYILLIVSILVIGFSALVSIPGSPFLINGMTQADISNLFPTAVTPAGITFSIWSLIYISWICAGLQVSGILSGFARKYSFLQNAWDIPKKKYHQAIYLFSTAVFLTGIWLIPWGYLSIGLSLLVMILLLGTLKYVYVHTRKAPLFLRSSVELTLWWINIATVANVTVWLISIGFTGWSIPVLYWAIGVLGFALLITLYYQLRYQAYIIPLVFIWAMIGEWIAHPIFEQRIAISIYAIISLSVVIYTFLRKRTK